MLAIFLNPQPDESSPALLHYTFKSNFNIMLPSTPKPSKWSSTFRFSVKPTYAFFFVTKINKNFTEPNRCFLQLVNLFQLSILSVLKFIKIIFKNLHPIRLKTLCAGITKTNKLLHLKAKQLPYRPGQTLKIPGG